MNFFRLSVLTLLLVAFLPVPASAQAQSPGPQVKKFAEEFLPWEPDSRVTVVPSRKESFSGFEAFKVDRKGKYDKLDTTVFYYVTRDHKYIFAGNLIKNSIAPNKTRAIKIDADVSGVGDLYASLYNAKAQAALNPKDDLGGLKAVTISMDTGYFSQAVECWVEPDASYLFMGTFWKLGESVYAQRKALMDLSSSPWTGVSSDPRITMVEYADMECPFCKKRGLEMDKLMDQYAAKLGIRRYYKYFPLWSTHVWSTRAASAGVCLARDSMPLLFKFKNLCYQDQEKLTVESLDHLAFDVADSAGIARAQFSSCYLQPSSFTDIRRDMAEGVRLGVNSTPTYYLNGVEIYWLPDGVMEDYLKDLLSHGGK